jgi:hypothetical protein
MARRQKRPVELHVLELMTAVKVLEMLVALLLADKFGTTDNPKQAGDDLVDAVSELFDEAQGKANRTSMEMDAATQRIVHRATSVALRWRSSEK